MMLIVEFHLLFVVLKQHLTFMLYHPAVIDFQYLRLVLIHRVYDLLFSFLLLLSLLREAFKSFRLTNVTGGRAGPDPRKVNVVSAITCLTYAHAAEAYGTRMRSYDAVLAS